AAPSSGTGDENTQYDLPTISGLSVQIPLGHYSWVQLISARKIEFQITSVAKRSKKFKLRKMIKTYLETLNKAV
ncbi:hypothetical protein, partial [Halopseudomonas bauzanensis]|uniref:hypothetical protein n=1 Tax=Halopseudomonas bauzanensis TaxID=653930 RepID=UPI001C4357B3